MLLGLATLLAFALVGCLGVGKPSLAGSHVFDGFLSAGHSNLDVWDPPPFSPFLFTEPPQATLGQFSPDGRWLYIAYKGDGFVSVASVGAHLSGRLLQVDLQLKSECQMDCTENFSVAATRVHLEPAVDPQNPPGVQVDGEPTGGEPWIPARR